MRTTIIPALLSTGVILASGCFADVAPSTDTTDTNETNDSTDSGDGDGDPGDGDGDGDPGDGDPGDGDGDPGDGDGDSGDGDGDQGCEPGSCPAGEYCVAGSCDEPPEGMVAVPAGPFWMGCNEEIDVDCNPDEYPYHEVMMSAFAIDRTEVTAAAYEECVTAGECTPTGANCQANSGMYPAGCVSWFQARDYCQWAGKQLPSEAQWEKAARGDDGRLYPWGNQPPTCNLVVMNGCGIGVELVGSRPAGASPYGALDMSGNVFEWVNDWYSSAYYVESPDADPPGPAEGDFRILRSGPYNWGAAIMRNSARVYVAYDFVPPTSYFPTSGFRCAYVP